MKNIYFCCRTSHEVRGLKFGVLKLILFQMLSHLTRGAWIEILVLLYHVQGRASHLTRGAWIEI